MTTKNKNRGIMRVTKELLSTRLLIPEDVHVDGIDFDTQREIVHVNLSTPEPKEDWTFPTLEGYEPQSVTGSIWEYPNSITAEEYATYEKVRSFLERKAL